MLSSDALLKRYLSCWLITQIWWRILWRFKNSCMWGENCNNSSYRPLNGTITASWCFPQSSVTIIWFVTRVVVLIDSLTLVFAVPSTFGLSRLLSFLQLHCSDLPSKGVLSNCILTTKSKRNVITISARHTSRTIRIRAIRLKPQSILVGAEKSRAVYPLVCDITWTYIVDMSMKETMHINP